MNFSWNQDCGIKVFYEICQMNEIIFDDSVKLNFQMTRHGISLTNLLENFHLVNISCQGVEIFDFQSITTYDFPMIIIMKKKKIRHYCILIKRNQDCFYYFNPTYNYIKKIKILKMNSHFLNKAIYFDAMNLQKIQISKKLGFKELFLLLLLLFEILIYQVMITVLVKNILIVIILVTYYIISKKMKDSL